MLGSNRTSSSLIALITLSGALACSAAGSEGGGDGDGDGDGDSAMGPMDGTGATGAGASSTGGGAATGGDAATGGAAATGGVAATGGATATGGDAGTGGDGTGGAPVDTCTPNAAGTLVVNGDVVLDETTCLTWMHGGIASAEMRDLDSEHVYPEATFWDAEIACENSTVGGYDDWRVPSLDEIQTILTECQQWTAPHVPWSMEFNDPNNMLWTSTPVSTKYCSIDVQGGGVATSSPSSGPGVRCVRGTGTVGSGATCSGCPL